MKTKLFGTHKILRAGLLACIAFAVLFASTLSACSKGGGGSNSSSSGSNSSGGGSNSSSVEKTNYSPGDEGPAEGLVFYDKGNSEGGWRYLEAAPPIAEFFAAWGSDYDIAGTETGIGTGKRNTAIIVEYLSGIGETGMAAQLCSELNINGFSDWFLPSKDELDLMYTVLHRNRKGDFSDGWGYWSSSQTGRTSAWSQNFYNGSQDDFTLSGKDTEYTVRAVRAF